MSPAAHALHVAFRSDRDALRTLFSVRVPCNEALADGPFIVVEETDGPTTAWTVGVLGLINGVLTAAGQPLVAAIYSDDNPPRLQGFCDHKPPHDTVS